MSIDEIEREIPLDVHQLFAHSNFIRAEIEQFKNAFERNERFKEFDGLIRTNHKMYEALEANFDDKQKLDDRLGTMARHVNSLAERLERIGRPSFSKDELQAMDLSEKPMSELVRLAESKSRQISEMNRAKSEKNEAEVAAEEKEAS